MPANTGTNWKVPKCDCFPLLLQGHLGQPTAYGENEKLFLIGEISLTSAEAWQGSSRQEGGLAGSSLLELSPELLLTSQVRESWDPLLCLEVRCCSPFLLAGNEQNGERAKQLTTKQQ